MGRLYIPLEAYLHNCSKYVTPVFADHHPSFRKPGVVQIGTATFFSNGENGYLLTAKHVIDQLPNDKVIIASKEKLFQISAHQISFETFVDYDIAVLKLSKQDFFDLQAYYTFSTPADIEDSNVDNRECLYLWVGFPNSKNKNDIKKRHFECRAFYTLCNKLVDIALLNDKRKTRGSHCAFSFDPKKTKMINSNSQSNFGLIGMSGGGIWKLKHNKELNLIEKTSLIGIGIEYRNAQKAIVGTKIESCIYAMIILDQKTLD